MTTEVKTNPIYPPRPSRSNPWAWLTAAMAVRRSRDDLRTLEPHMLNDVGLTGDEAQNEADRPVWDVPGHWMK